MGTPTLCSATIKGKLAIRLSRRTLQANHDVRRVPDCNFRRQLKMKETGGRGSVPISAMHSYRISVSFSGTPVLYLFQAP